MAQQAVPETREMRFSLEPFPSLVSAKDTVRGSRITYDVNRNLRILRRAEQKRLRRLRRSWNPFLNVELKTNRQLKNVSVFNKRVEQHGAKATMDFKTHQITVDLPAEHKICKERQARREIMFATDKAGQGGQKPRRKDSNIELRCEK